MIMKPTTINTEAPKPVQQTPSHGVIPDRLANVVNSQLYTRWDASSGRITTDIIERPLAIPPAGSIMVEVLYVPMHGSFWLASHPSLGR